jgi:hypothetical protein
MSSRVAISAATLAFACAACGLIPVELDAAPDRQAIVIGDVPRSAIERLAADDAQAAGPMPLTFVYPSDGAGLPDGIAPITFEWRMMPGPMSMPPKAAPAMPNDMPAPPAMMMMAGAPKHPAPASGADHIVYELRCLSADADLRLYTDAAAASFPSERWRALLHDHVGETLRVELRALQPSGQITRAVALNLALRAGVVAGSLYAWSTSAQGIVVAGLQATSANYLSPPPAAPGETAGACLGCHSVSRDGRRVLAAVGGSPRMISWQPSVAGTRLAFEGPALAANDSYAFGSFDPTATRVAIAYAGSLRLYDADTGQLLTEASWPGLAVDHPDWSPDGRFIAVSTSALGPEPDKAHASRGIARIRVGLDGTLASPESVLMGMMPKDGLRRYPAYSPDGAFIAYEQHKGPDDTADSTLWLVAADGGEPIQLQRAAADPKLGAALDGAPSWLPTDVPGQAWLVFSAERPIGSFVPAAGQRQLFLSALDLPLAAAGGDPSLPAFWLPFQERASSYRRAQWARAVGVCRAALEQCNELDDDCDGRVDESCCTPAPESCGDGVDNDCDGQSDEGCGCAFREICGDGIDNDCNLSIDEPPCTAPGMPAAR